MTTDYKNYVLENVSNWLHDAISCGEATPQEVYDKIKSVVQEEYEIYRKRVDDCNELLALLNGTVRFNLNDSMDYYYNNVNYSDSFNAIDPGGNVVNFCNSTDTSEYCKSSWNSFWEEDTVEEPDKVKSWVLPVQQKIEEGIDNYFVQFPDDLLDAANLKEGDKVYWVNNFDGSFTLKKR